MRALLIALLFSVNAFAWDLQAVLGLQMPPDWICEEHSGAHACYPGQGPAKQQAVIIFVAAPASDNHGQFDSLDKLETYLRTYHAANRLQARTRYLRRSEVGGTVWVDALKDDSELLGFSTRYLCTLAPIGGEPYAILVTASVVTAKLTELAPVLDRILLTLELAPPPTREVASTSPARLGPARPPEKESEGTLQAAPSLSQFNLPYHGRQSRPVPRFTLKLPSFAEMVDEMKRTAKEAYLRESKLKGPEPK